MLILFSRAKLTAKGHVHSATAPTGGAWRKKHWEEAGGEGGILEGWRKATRAECRAG